MANFRRYIVNPFGESEPGRQLATQRLTALIDSLCIRRTKELLHLPQESRRVRMLEFSLGERNQYERTKKFMIQTIKQHAGEYDHQDSFGMFQAQLQLRIMCNHGTYQHGFQFQRRSLRDEREHTFYSNGGNDDIHSPDGFTTKLNSDNTIKSSEEGDDTYFRSEGYSTKMAVLMQDVKENLVDTKRHVSHWASGQIGPCL